ncbi:MAG TPA: NPCBM/NEW2 domain-containing protein [Gemmataceae bacterium]|nr:NPCBM/NEW2 domain-containing protein [Gemmataceae bacterium]
MIGSNPNTRENKPEPIPFLLQAADGKQHTGPLEGIGQNWSVRLGGKFAHQEPGENVLHLCKAGLPRPPYPKADQVIFANGDRIPGKILQLKGERLSVRADLGKDQEVILPLSAIAVIWFTAPDPEPYPTFFLRQLIAGKRRKDMVYLRNGDVLEGFLKGFEDNSLIKLEVDKKEVQVDFNKAAAIALNTDLARSLRPKERYGRVTLENGCRLGLAGVRLTGATLIGKTLFGAEVTIPMESVSALDMYQGRSVFLSDLKPIKYEATPFLGIRWNYVMDGSVLKNNHPAGDDLRLQGNTYDKGIGMHSPSRITFDLDGQYRWFETLVGLDETHGKLGVVRIRVEVDGKVANLGFEKELTGRDGAVPIRLFVEKARQLTLVVESGKFGDVQDHVNWVNAQLIK